MCHRSSSEAHLTLIDTYELLVGISILETTTTTHVHARLFPFWKLSSILQKYLSFTYLSLINFIERFIKDKQR